MGWFGDIGFTIRNSTVYTRQFRADTGIFGDVFEGRWRGDADFCYIGEQIRDFDGGVEEE